MSEKKIINVGVFSIKPSSSIENTPIGLAFHSAELDEFDIAVADQGHHQSLYVAYMRTLPGEISSQMPGMYFDGADAFGFHDNTPLPDVYYLERQGRRAISQEMAARALFVSLCARTYYHLPADNKMREMQVSQERLDKAIVRSARRST